MKRDLVERLAALSTPAPGGCRVWVGYSERGYGRIAVDGRPRWAHRVAYELFRGLIPEGKEIDHLCRVRGCINPDHLDAVTHQENLMRGNACTALNARKAHCLRGHVLTPDHSPSRIGRRTCQACARIRERNRSLRKGAE